jgi:uncharacterized protein GlcG (DUF336 family)
MRRISALVSALALALALAAGGTLPPAVAQEGTPAAGAAALTEAEVQAILDAAVAAAEQTPSALRVDAQGAPRPTRMHVAVVDPNGRLLGLRSMEGAWPVSVDIALAKAYTAAAVSSDENAVSSRALGLLTQPGGPLWNVGHSNDPGTGDDSVEERGLIEFPGGLPLYKEGRHVGGIGVSGDGVEQDEAVAAAGAAGYEPPAVIRVDCVLGWRGPTPPAAAPCPGRGEQRPAPPPKRARSGGRPAESPPTTRGGSSMDRICVVFPLLPGKTEDARAFQRELDTDRKADYARSERRIGITKEHWFIASVPAGDQLVAYMEGEDFGRALGLFAQSRDGFDVWFKDRLAEVTGVDLNNPPPDLRLPELVSSYEAA